MLEKLLEKVPKTLAVLSAVGMIYGCGTEECQAPAYNEQTLTETQMSALSDEQGIVEELETQNQYLMATCPSGCSYDSSVGCCWCPN